MNENNNYYENRNERTLHVATIKPAGAKTVGMEIPFVHPVLRGEFLNALSKSSAPLDIKLTTQRVERY